MKIVDFKIYQYRLPFKSPMFIRGHTFSEREGILIQLTDDNENHGFGDVSPLPEVSPETLTQAHEELKRIYHLIIDQDIRRTIENTNFCSSVKFGIESAVLSLLSNAKGIPMAYLLKSQYQTRLNLTGLLQGSLDEIIQDAETLVKRGYKSLKLKVGHSSLTEDIIRVKALTQVNQGKALLRLDANQSWELDEAVTFIKAIDWAIIEFVEQPLKNANQIPEFYEATSVPVALDESLLHLSLKQISQIEGVEVLVIKPTLLGGMEKCWQLAQDAMKRAFKVVISSSYESGLGLQALAHLAACCSRNTAVGLDTRKWFQEDLLINHFQIQNGSFPLSSSGFQKDNINFSLLDECSC